MVTYGDNKVVTYVCTTYVDSIGTELETVTNLSAPRLELYD